MSIEENSPYPQRAVPPPPPGWNGAWPPPLPTTNDNHPDSVLPRLRVFAGRPVAIIAVAFVFLMSLMVAGWAGFFYGALIIACAMAVSAGLRAIGAGIADVWRKSPIAIVIAVLGIVFLALFFVHYNSLTCTVKGGWVINLGSGNSLCIGPS